MQTRYGTKRTQRGLLMNLAAMTLLSGCANTNASATERTICRELARDLPSYSRSDTPDTLASGARFLDVFAAVCG
jgi:hypothetical protein